MASTGRFMKNGARFLNNCRKVKSSSAAKVSTLSGNLTKTARCSSAKIFGVENNTILNSVNQQNPFEMRQLQTSVAVMSLTSKVSACLNVCGTSDVELCEGSEDGDDVCSQPRHKR